MMRGEHSVYASGIHVQCTCICAVVCFYPLIGAYNVGNHEFFFWLGHAYSTASRCREKLVRTTGWWSLSQTNRDFAIAQTRLKMFWVGISYASKSIIYGYPFSHPRLRRRASLSVTDKSQLPSSVPWATRSTTSIILLCAIVPYSYLHLVQWHDNPKPYTLSKCFADDAPFTASRLLPFPFSLIMFILGTAGLNRPPLHFVEQLTERRLYRLMMFTRDVLNKAITSAGVFSYFIRNGKWKPESVLLVSIGIDHGINAYLTSHLTCKIE